MKEISRLSKIDSPAPGTCTIGGEQILEPTHSLEGQSCCLRVVITAQIMPIDFYPQEARGKARRGRHPCTTEPSVNLDEDSFSLDIANYRRFLLM